MEKKVFKNEIPKPTKEEKELVKAALDGMANAYAPYSGYTVGAAVRTSDGKIFNGCNIENAAYSPCICAERTALFKAVSEGHRSFASIAVCGGKGGRIKGVFPPCGVCRQVLREFCSTDMPVLLIKSKTTFERTTLGELLPMSFSPADIDK